MNNRDFIKPGPSDQIEPGPSDQPEHIGIESPLKTRIAWVYPSIVFGAYWRPVVEAFCRKYPNSLFFTGQAWPEFDPQDQNNRAFRVIGKTRYVAEKEQQGGYSRAFLLASPWIVWPLLRFRPAVVFASAYSIWTMLMILSRPLGRWKLVIMYDGSTPNADFRDSWIRTALRRWLTRRADALLANSKAARSYLVEVLGASRNKVFLHNYLVPDVTALQSNPGSSDTGLHSQLARPVFLYVGQLIERKGISNLLRSLCLLKEQGIDSFHLLVVGDGNDRQSLQRLAKDNSIAAHITWAGWVDYASLGYWFEQADVFVFPTFEDVWGMVVLESMAFGKPVVCSSLANAAEVVEHGRSGYIYDPHDVAVLADHLRSLISSPELVDSMSRRALEAIRQRNPASAASGFDDVVSNVLDNNDAH